MMNHASCISMPSQILGIDQSLTVVKSHGRSERGLVARPCKTPQRLTCQKTIFNHLLLQPPRVSNCQSRIQAFVGNEWKWERYGKHVKTYESILFNKVVRWDARSQFSSPRLPLGVQLRHLSRSSSHGSKRLRGHC